MASDELVLGVSDFVALINQTLEYAYPNVTVTGELANFKVSKNRWVYFDLKDDTATVRFFGTVYQLSGPLEDGMILAVKGVPRMHPQYGFSINVLTLRPVGEGSIKKAAALLQAKLAAEGLFDPARKRVLPYPPTRIGLIASQESAAYRDFVKVLGERWGGAEITLIDVQVQGEAAPRQLTAAIEQFNQMAKPPEVLVMTRGGGSADDLQAFSTEQVTRAVAASRIPTMVAIGHEVDFSLAELAADRRASTPSNAAELLVPDKHSETMKVRSSRNSLAQAAIQTVRLSYVRVEKTRQMLNSTVDHLEAQAKHRLDVQKNLLEAYNPKAALQRGYALVKINNKMVRGGAGLHQDTEIEVELSDASVVAIVKRVTMKEDKRYA